MPPLYFLYFFILVCIDSCTGLGWAYDDAVTVDSSLLYGELMIMVVVVS